LARAQAREAGRHEKVELEAFKRRLRAVLARKQEMVEAVAGVPQSTLSAWMGPKARKFPPADSLTRVAQAAGVSVEWLVAGKAKEKPPVLLAAGIDDATLAQVLELITSELGSVTITRRSAAKAARIIARIYAGELQPGEIARARGNLKILIHSLR
jgi:transcriptional regulator with XRE-family HTH domain